ncbi:MAG: hypothetical protein WBA97_21065 [Actinophytocola sp.]|uniref:hypothetical protein n=1 Tax=Actinophytocola sp. TaxID=1872138 RepID=UPI003C7206B1
MRHLDRAAQLPVSASGNRLCRHRAPGGCTVWCSYKLFAKAITCAIVVLSLICGGIWLAGEQQRVREVLYSIAVYLTLIVPGVIWTNTQDHN